MLASSSRNVYLPATSTPMDTNTSAQNEISVRGLWNDLVVLTKARLSVLVVITAVFGYLAAARATGAFSWPGFLHTGIGTLLAALGSGVFNQLMEIDADARMTRTAERPLPANRLPRAGAFLLGWLLSALGIVHLAAKLNFTAGALAAATLFVYLFVYTPLKRRSSLNTIVGAVAGALPPLIGWAAGGGALTEIGAFYLFGLLFFWQLPHFAAINWMYRKEYVKGGFVMWSNDDENGRKTARLALLFSLCLTAVGLAGALTNTVNWTASLGIIAASLYMTWLALRFLKSSLRQDAKKLFFLTLIYLPIAMALGCLGWKASYGN